jgi:hypothetical protein
MIGELPAWAGTVPQWFMLASILITIVKLYPVVRKQNMEHANVQVKQYAETCLALRNDVRVLTDKLIACEDNCDKEIRKLHEEIFGLQRNNIQSQISLVNAIIQSVDAPELKTMLKSLESVQATLRVSEVIQTQDGKVIHRDDKGGSSGA